MGTPIYRYLGCDLRTGRIAEELRALRPTGALSRRMGASTNTTFELALAGAPREWEAATDPARTLIVAVDEDTGLPVWSGIPLPRAGGSASTAKITTATPEAYLERRYPTYSGTGVDLGTAMAGVCAPLLVQGPALTIDATSVGVSVDYTVADTDDKSVLSCLQELDALADVGEWTIDTIWADAAQSAVQLVVRIRPLLGVQTATPAAVFDMPGCLTDYVLTESYERGKGATSVIARGEGQGASRLTSAAHTADALIASGWCLWEHRYTPATQVTDTGQLDAHAAQALDLLQGGSRAWTLAAATAAAPRVGRDWGLGDSVAIDIESSPRHPDGVTAVARVYGWDISATGDQVTPILLEDA